MNEIRITGGIPLQGSIRIQGSKNAALPMMAAALLQRETCVLRGCPRIADVFCMKEILSGLGAAVWWEGADLHIDCRRAEGTKVPEAAAGRMRSSVILLGALLGRNGRAVMGYPGGCVIGERPVDQHIRVLKMLGAELMEENGRILAKITGKRSGSAAGLTGAEITFDKISVGAAEQGILAAVLAEGETILRGCAREPEIYWLCRFLRRMGADIEGKESGCIRIRGVRELHGAEMQVPPDRIVAGTYLCVSAATRSRIVIKNFPEGELDAFLEVYRKIGGQWQGNSGKLIADGRGVGAPLPFLETEAYPGFPTDLQSPLMAALATVPGESRIRENIFEDRFKIVEELNRMGASVTVSGREALIRGGFPLKGCPVTARELRGGAGLIVAALAAKGETLIRGSEFIRRGYEHICRDLRSLGALAEEDTGINAL